MTDATTNPCVSNLHANIMRRELSRAQNEAELREVADRHTRFLLDKDLIALREAYAERLKKVRSGHVR
jgi:hypothetical protein